MTEKKKLIPPVPKFSAIAPNPQNSSLPKTNQGMEEEIQKFFAEINKTTSGNKLPQKPIEIQETQPNQQQIKKQSVTAVKDLSSINSKLSDLLKKRDLLNKDVQSNTLTNSPQATIKQNPIPCIVVQNQLQQLGASEEYDPGRPNDYEEYKKNYQEKLKLNKQKNIESIDEQNKQIHNKTYQIEQETVSEKIVEEPLQQKSAEQKALKMMQKYGFKLGEGLGKNSQGMTTPLIAQKTSDTIGVIKASSLEMDKVIQMESIIQQDNNQISSSRVLVLLNMVTPNQVDGDLESEIVLELSKYGKIKKCLIFMQPHLAEDIAVRIFVEFQQKEDAKQALLAVDGRVFEKRIVMCRYYSEVSFDNNILDEQII